MWPDLGEIEGIEAIGCSIPKRHDLHFQPPDWVILLQNGFAQVSTMVVGIFRCHRPGLSISKVLDALLGLEVIFDPEFFACGIDPHERMATITVHMTQGARRATVRHEE